ncbi:MAG: hypothetical protein ACRD5L_17415, partial [Bryobacteraceae bacterium]
QARSIDKAHGRIETRELRVQPTDAAALGLAGAAQVFRIDHTTEYRRGGEVLKTTRDRAYELTSLWPEEAGPERLLQLKREYWAIENRQHYRRDRTQREDHCQVRASAAARNLSLMRSAAIFLYERQRRQPNGKTSLPDWESRNHRDPNRLIRLLVARGT